MTEELKDFEQFIARREVASAAYADGNPEPVGQIVTRGLEATFFPPHGGIVSGADKVAERYMHDAKYFEPGSQFRFEKIQMEASGGVAYWVGTMQGEARMRGEDTAVPMKLRVTEIFRKENGEWKMVHRHADSLFDEKKPD